MSRLQHLFKKDTGQSIHEYLHWRRHEEAARLLADPCVRISEVGYRLGFGLPSSFTHWFRREYGVPPRDYRRRLLDSHTRRERAKGDRADPEFENGAGSNKQ